MYINSVLILHYQKMKVNQLIKNYLQIITI